MSKHESSATRKFIRATLDLFQGPDMDQVRLGGRPDLFFTLPRGKWKGYPATQGYVQMDAVHTGAVAAGIVSSLMTYLSQRRGLEGSATFHSTIVELIP